MEMPAEIQIRPNDCVSYDVIFKDKKESYNKVCYNSHMIHLAETEFFLMPNREYNLWEKYISDGGVYLKWIQILKDNKIVPEEVEATVEGKKLLMHIPKKELARDKIYASLCAYRWAESCAPFVYAIVKLTETQPELPIWQILHYGMSRFVKLAGHSWTNIVITSKKEYMSNFGQSFNLAIGLAAPLFWCRSEENFKKETAGWTNEKIIQISRQISSYKKVGYFNLPNLLVCANIENNDILNPRWTPFYKLTSVASCIEMDYNKLKLQLEKMYKEIYDKDEDLKKLEKEMEKQLNTPRY